MQTVVPANQSTQQVMGTINSQRQPEDQIAISHQVQNEPNSAQIKTPGNRII